jgi:formate hydrogenlyase subunit 6/NADH:ubiquinone oxidoreductase subunit I
MGCVEAAATEALSETEQHILRSLQQWDAIFKSTDADDGRAQKTKKTSQHREINLNEIAVELIDNITMILADLRSELEEPGAPHSSEMG